MFLIIGIWGGRGRIYATVKFFLYTFFGSVFMLVALLYLYSAGRFVRGAGSACGRRSIFDAQVLIFLAFLIAFAVKVPMWPVHTWLPDAHVEAPTGGSVVLAAVMLKLGGYGFVRFSLPIAPDASAALDWLMILLSLDGHRLHRLRRLGPARHEEAHRLLIDLAHGFCDARVLYRV